MADENTNYQSGNTINAKEYEAFLAEMARVKQARDDAESEFMFQTYDRMLSLLKKRKLAAERLNITLSNKADREVKKQKLETFKQAKASA